MKLILDMMNIQAMPTYVYLYLQTDFPLRSWFGQLATKNISYLVYLQNVAKSITKTTAQWFLAR